MSVTSSRGFTLEGFVNTSHGTVDTKVVQSIDFSNRAKVLCSFGRQRLRPVRLDRHTTISSVTTTQDSSNVITNSKQYSWPLNVTYAFTANPDGSYQQYATIRQAFQKSELVQLNGTPTYSSTFSDAVAPTRFADGGRIGQRHHEGAGQLGDLSVLQFQRRMLERDRHRRRWTF